MQLSICRNERGGLQTCQDSDIVDNGEAEELAWLDHTFEKDNLQACRESELRQEIPTRGRLKHTLELPRPVLQRMAGSAIHKLQNTLRAQLALPQHQRTAWHDLPDCLPASKHYIETNSAVRIKLVPKCKVLPQAQGGRLPCLRCIRDSGSVPRDVAMRGFSPCIVQLAPLVRLNLEKQRFGHAAACRPPLHVRSEVASSETRANTMLGRLGCVVRGEEMRGRAWRVHLPNQVRQLVDPRKLQLRNTQHAGHRIMRGDIFHACVRVTQDYEIRCEG